MRRHIPLFFWHWSIYWRSQRHSIQISDSISWVLPIHPMDFDNSRGNAILSSGGAPRLHWAEILFGKHCYFWDLKRRFLQIILIRFLINDFLWFNIIFIFIWFFKDNVLRVIHTIESIQFCYYVCCVTSRRMRRSIRFSNLLWSLRIFWIFVIIVP